MIVLAGCAFGIDEDATGFFELLVSLARKMLKGLLLVSLALGAAHAGVEYFVVENQGCPSRQQSAICHSGSLGL